MSSAAQKNQRVRSALESRFSAPEWALLFEVANGTGGRTRSYADAIAFNMWPSRGLVIHGIEIKVERRDWIRELKNPDKSVPVQKYCDRWWVAVANTSIVEPGELPATWGLLVLEGRRLVAKKEAPPLEPAPLDRGFLAALARRMTEGVKHAQATVQARIEADRPDTESDYERGAADMKKRLEDRHAIELRRYDAVHQHLLSSVKAFEEQSGLKIDRYNGKKLGQAVAAFQRIKNARRWCEGARSHGEDIVTAAEEMLAHLPDESDAQSG